MSSAASSERWVVLTYKVPRNPTASRVYVWRKLKQLGAIALQDAVWVLPATPKTREHFQWLAADIAELGGEARLWSSTLLLEAGDETLRDRFRQQVENEYKQILAALRRNKRDLTSLARRYQQASVRDYFASELGRTVREKLLVARKERHR